MHSHPSGREADDPVHRFEQRAIVAGHQRPAAPLCQQLRDRIASRRVEIVRRLVQQQQVGRVDQQSGNGDPHALPATEAGQQALRIECGQSGSGQRGFDPLRQCPIGLGKVCLRPAASLDPGQAGKRWGNSQCLRHGFLTGRHGLGEPPDTAGNRDGASRWANFASDSAQQRGLSRAIAPHQADAFAPHGKGEAGEQRNAGGRGQGHMIENEKG